MLTRDKPRYRAHGVAVPAPTQREGKVTVRKERYIEPDPEYIKACKKVRRMHYFKMQHMLAALRGINMLTDEERKLFDEEGIPEENKRQILLNGGWTAS